MAAAIEIRERHKFHLQSLLNIKKETLGMDIPRLHEEIKVAVAVMEQEDVAWVEKIVGITAL